MLKIMLAQSTKAYSSLPKSGEKPCLEVPVERAIFWMIMFKQQFLHSDWLKTCQLIPNQWNFASATLNQSKYCFKCITLCQLCSNLWLLIVFVFYHVQYQRYNEINLCQDLLTIEETDSALKVHALHYANEVLVRLQTRSTWGNNMKKWLGKE